jgi:AraC-like DNA-binding protein
MDTELENAIQCCEKFTGLTVTVHDLRKDLWNVLPLRRYRHTHPFCSLVKAQNAGTCLRLEITEFRKSASLYVNGRVHRCHAGLDEMVLPVFMDGALRLVLFAGPVRVKHTSQLDMVCPQTCDILSGRLPEPPVIGPEALSQYKEMLMQLAMRLRCWIEDHDQHGVSPDLPRRYAIEEFIESQHPRPVKIKDLARVLHLSSERTRRVVIECFDESFSSLLRRTRLRAACSLLLNTEYSVSRIAEESGWGDTSAFHKAFRFEFQDTPHQWRIKWRG